MSLAAPLKLIAVIEFAIIKVILRPRHQERRVIQRQLSTKCSLKERGSDSEDPFVEAAGLFV